jgi:hypothetical protein
MTVTLAVRVPAKLAAAIARAAAERLQTQSEFVRQAVLGELRRGGLDPARGDGEQQAA